MWFSTEHCLKTDTSRAAAGAAARRLSWLILYQTSVYVSWLWFAVVSSLQHNIQPSSLHVPCSCVTCNWPPDTGNQITTPTQATQVSSWSLAAKNSTTLWCHRYDDELITKHLAIQRHAMTVGKLFTLHTYVPLCNWAPVSAKQCWCSEDEILQAWQLTLCWWLTSAAWDE